MVVVAEVPPPLLFSPSLSVCLHNSEDYIHIF